MKRVDSVIVNWRLALTATGLLGALALPAAAAPVVIQDGFIRAGVSSSGLLGSDGATSPGILYDQTGASLYGINDFLTPGSPFEGSYYQATLATGGTYFDSANNECVGGGYNAGPCGFTTTSGPTNTTGTSATWSGSDGTLNVTNSYALSTVAGQSIIAVTTSLTNATGSTLTNLDFLRTLDPDPDVNAFGSFFTTNSLFSLISANDEACGTGPDTGQTICITTTDESFIHQAGVSGGTNSCEGGVEWDITPSHWLPGCLISDGNGDYSIGEAFSLGSLAAGATDTITYDYVLGGSLPIASGGGTVPEPASLLLLASGLLGLPAAIRRRRARRV